MDGYQQASVRSLLIMVALLVVIVIVIYLVASSGLISLNAPGVENYNEPALPGIGN